MFKLKDFYHLPQLEDYFNQLILDQHPGIVLVAGSEAHPAAPGMSSGFFVSSGRNMIFDLIYQTRLFANPSLKAILVTQGKERARQPQSLKARVQISLAPDGGSYVHRLENAISQNQELLIVDHLDVENCATVVKAATEGKQVIAQVDTLLWGNEIMGLLNEMGVDHAPPEIVRWIISVQRLAGLCPECKRPTSIRPDQMTTLNYRYPWLVNGINLNEGNFCQPGICQKCNSSGRSEHVIAFDIYSGALNNQSGASVLPLEEYMFRLAAAGIIPLDDLLHHTSNHLRRLYNLIQHSRYALNDANANLARKTAELEAANQVLLKRTETLITLQDTLQMLSASDNLNDLAQRVCQKARDVCGADHAIVYYFHHDSSPPEAQILAVVGWDPRLQGHRLPADLLQGRGRERQLAPNISLPLGEIPKGITAHTASILSGMRVPLISQGQHLGAIILHSDHKSYFNPGEAALLETFANQAAIAIQRASLVYELRRRLKELEAAQAELVNKERLEHELELAKQVQQSILPRSFPTFPGFTFSAANLPARQVGGDFYDVIRLDNEHFGLLIADVSDKGMPAALYMALTRSLLLAEAHRSRSPKVVLENVHRLLLELGQADMFVSVFYAVMDAKNILLRYTRAGHERPLLVRDMEVSPLPGDGTVLGILDPENLNLEEHEIKLQPGDRLILFTDGILDTSNSKEEFFGIHRFKSLLASLKELPTDLVCQRVFDALTGYEASYYQFDDRTMLILDIEDNKPE